MTLAGDRRVDVARPGEAGYAAATQVFNLHAPPRPDVATTVRDVGQVRAALRFAAREGLAVRVHGTGHGAASARPMDRSLLLRTRFVGGVELDLDRRVVRVPAGTRWRDVVAATAGHGLAAPHGSSGDVGVVGYLLRGGVSLYGRHVGLAGNSVRAVELVTADGTLHRVDATADPELFWAVRGGGGGLGVVTAVEVALFPLARAVTGASYWPAALGDRVLAHWLAWARHAPESATTSFQVLTLPDVPSVPPQMRDRMVVGLTGTVLATGADARPARDVVDELLAPCRTAADPLLETWQECSPAEVVTAQVGPEEPVALTGDHLLLRDLDPEGAARFLALTGAESGTPMVSAELRQLGGALGRPDPQGGALDHLPGALAYLGAAFPGPERDGAIARHCAEVRAALEPWNTGWTAPTFVESVDQPQRHLSADRIDRVDRVRLRTDPTGIFRGDVSPGASRRY